MNEHHVFLRSEKLTQCWLALPSWPGLWKWV